MGIVYLKTIRRRVIISFIRVFIRFRCERLA